MVPWTRFFGLAGVLAGLLVLVVFVVSLPQALNPYRLIVIFAGVIAVTVGVHLRQRGQPAPLAQLSAAAVIVANGWYLGMTIFRLLDVNPFGANFGFIEFLAGVSMWLGAAAFGATIFAIGSFSRLGPALLIVGSLLAITGIDRLGLTSAANETVFGPISLVGIALYGLTWILLGAELALRRPVEGFARTMPLPPSFLGHRGR